MEKYKQCFTQHFKVEIFTYYHSLVVLENSSGFVCISVAFWPCWSSVCCHMEATILFPNSWVWTPSLLCISSQRVGKFSLESLFFFLLLLPVVLVFNWRMLLRTTSVGRLAILGSWWLQVSLAREVWTVQCKFWSLLVQQMSFSLIDESSTFQCKRSGRINLQDITYTPHLSFREKQ